MIIASITLTTPQVITASLGVTGLLFTISAWVYSLGSRLAKGSEKIDALCTDVKKLQDEMVSREILRLIERRVENNEKLVADLGKAILNQDTKMAERFGAVENKLTKIATTLEMMYMHETGREVKINED